MNPEELKELRELIEFLKENKIGEFDLERGELKVRIKFASEGSSQQVDMAQMARMFAAAPVAPVAAASPAAPVAAAAPAAETSEDAGLHEVKSPIVGTFYDAPSPGAAPYVKPGDQVELGQVLCIIEAMKLMNEIECDVAGEVVKRIVVPGQPVEYGQALFVIKPR